MSPFSFWVRLNDALDVWSQVPESEAIARAYASTCRAASNSDALRELRSKSELREPCIF